MKLFNTLTRNIEETLPRDGKTFLVYTCGPTVYDFQHIGNYLYILRVDLLIRVLQSTGFAVRRIMNITDVGHLVSDDDEGEDKMVKGAKREGKSAWDVAKFYSDDFLKNLDWLGIVPPDDIVLATSCIAEQIGFIKSLEKKGYTYVIDDGVYFDTTKIKDYGRLARLDIDGLKAGARVQMRGKKNITDFALWKFSPKNEQRDMEWDSPWGRGFPGWHIECSAIALKYLGDQIDIHTGGIEHIPVHHPNEIAQTESLTGKEFSHIWLHSNHLMIDNKKIAKSGGNGLYLQDLRSKDYTADDFRIFVYESHYRTQANFTWEGLDGAKNRLQHWREVADLQWQPVDNSSAEHIIQEAKTKFVAALQDDLNSPAALALIDALFSKLEVTRLGHDDVVAFQELLNEVYKLLGISFNSSDITEAQKKVITKRQVARDAKDWTAADSLRQELLAQAIGLKDEANSTVWYHLPEAA